MFKLLAVFAAALVLAYISEQNTKAAIAAGHRYCVWRDWAYVLLVIVLTLFAGLRTGYNDSLLSSKLQKNMSEKWLLFKKATFSDCIEGSFL